MGIYKLVQYYLMQGNESDETKKLLKAGGGKREFYLSDMVTHVISSSSSPQFVTSIVDMNAAVVTEEWVRLSSQCNALLPCEPFSLLPNRLFSSVVACTSQVTKGDRNRLWAMLTFYGGQLKLHLDSKCTHLLVPEPVGDKFAKACAFQEKIKIVTPDWVRDCAAEKRLLPVADYFPVKEDAPPKTAADYAEKSPRTKDAASSTTQEGKELSQEKTPQTEKHISLPGDCVDEQPTLPSPPVTSTTSTVCLPSESSQAFIDPRFTCKEDTVVSSQPQTQLRSARVVYATPDKPRSIKPSNISSQATNIAPPCNMRRTSSQPRGHQVVERQVSERHAAQKDKTAPSHVTSQNVRQETSSLGEKCHVLCLSGCVFVFIDYQDCMEEGTLDGWKRIVEQHGGQVDEVYSRERCTHLLAMNQCSAVCQQAIQDGKKVVAAHWLNDVLEQQRLFAPCKVLHLPTPYQDTLPGCINMVISLTGYLALERHLVKDMILLTGAKFTSSLSRENTHLICKCPNDSLKFSKAQQWNVAIVNARWLADILTTGEIPKHSLPQYQQFGLAGELMLRPECVYRLLAPWKTPATPALSIPVKRMSVPAAIKGVHPLPAAKYPKCSNEDRPQAPQILLTGLVPAANTRLTQLLHKIGGARAVSAKYCTHLVAPRVARTVKFLSAVSTALYIVTPKWIEDSFHKGHFLDERDYLLKDPVSEEQLQFSMDLTMRRRAARKHGVLHGVVVYCTPSVEPPINGLRSIVECAGGEVIKRLPSHEQLLLLVKKSTSNRRRFVVLSCQEDLHLCTTFLKLNIGVYATELIMSGVLQQRIDYTQFRLDCEDTSL